MTFNAPIAWVLRFGAAALGVFALLAGLGFVVNAAWAAWVRRRFAPKGARVPFPGGTLRVVRRGAGPPVVLVHGMNGTAHDFPDALLDDLARDHDVIALDRPGHAGSDRMKGRPDLAANARAVLAAFAGSEAPAVLVGHSYGAAVVLRAALDAPGRVVGVVLVAPCTVVDARNRSYAELPVPPGFARGLALRIGTMPVGFLLSRRTRRDAWFPERPPAGFTFSRAWALVASQLEAALANFHTLRPDLDALARELPRLSVPLVVLAGRCDRITPCGPHAEWLPRVVPGAVLRVFDATGHWLPRQRPGEVARAVREVRSARGEG